MCQNKTESNSLDLEESRQQEAGEKRIREASQCVINSKCAEIGKTSGTERITFEPIMTV